MFIQKGMFLYALIFSISTLLNISNSFADGKPQSNQYWWPEKLSLEPLRQHDTESNPMGENFNYADAFQTLDLDAVKKDLEKVKEPHILDESTPEAAIFDQKIDI